MRVLTTRLKTFFSLIFFIAIFANHGLVSAETKESGGEHQGHHAMDWPGIYNGFLPCADCIGLKMSLALNKRGSYVLITQYVGKSPRDFVEKGKFTWNAENNTVLLTSRDKSKTHQFLVGDDMLIQLDDKGNRISGELADRYILRRNDVTESATAPAHGH